MPTRLTPCLAALLMLSGCQPSVDPSSLSDTRLNCTTVQFIAHPGDEADPFLQGNQGRRFVLDFATAGNVDVTVPDAGNWPSDFRFTITGERQGVLSARHQAFNRLTGAPNPNLSYELRLSPVDQPGYRTGELRSTSSFRGAPRSNRWLLSCENAGPPA